jgi:hypothetical protein
VILIQLASIIGHRHIVSQRYTIVDVRPRGLETRSCHRAVVATDTGQLRAGAEWGGHSPSHASSPDGQAPSRVVFTRSARGRRGLQHALQHPPCVVLAVEVVRHLATVGATLAAHHLTHGTGAGVGPLSGKRRQQT